MGIADDYSTRTEPMNPEEELDRRTIDPTIVAFMETSNADRKDIRAAIAAVQDDLRANTAVTKDIADILTSLRVFGVVGKWIAAVGAGVAAVWHGIYFIGRK